MPTKLDQYVQDNLYEGESASVGRPTPSLCFPRRCHSQGSIAAYKDARQVSEKASKVCYQNCRDYLTDSDAEMMALLFKKGRYVNISTPLTTSRRKLN